MDEENEVYTDEKKKNNSIENARRKVTNRLTKTQTKNSALKGKLKVLLGPIIKWGIIIILIIILLVGIAMFFITMPGMVMEKLKALGRAIAKAWNSWWGSDDTKYIEDKQINDALDYLEEMGYDLEGFGFLTDYLTINNKDEIEKSLGKDSLSNGEYRIDADNGVVRDSDGKIAKAKSDYIKTYLASDNYVYTIKNHNLVTDSGWVAFWQHVGDFFGGSFGEKLTRGLIAVYNEGDKGIGDRGSYYSDTGLFNTDKMGLDVETRKLSLRRGSGNKTMEYDLDGWTGRYGMPIDFLMAVHIATMMPDLAYDMANHFDTEIVLILHKIDNADVESAYKNGTQMISYSELSKLSNEDWMSWLTPDDFSVDEAIKAMLEFNIKIDGIEGSTFEEVKEKNADKLSIIEDTMQAILNNVKNSKTENYYYYLPYIESVKNHWYRNVYYAINTANTKEYQNQMENENIALIQYDYDYEALMHERWTLYKTYENGEFKYYALNESGDYATSESEIENYSSDMFEKEGNYYLFKGSEEEQKKALQGSDEYVRYRVAKMAESVSVSSDEFADFAEDLSWNSDSSIWTVYKNKGKFSTEYEALDKTSTDAIKAKVFTRITSSKSITQTGEGQRSETNPDIKKMFMENVYFRYDGTKNTAEIITALRNKLKDSEITDTGNQYGPLNELIYSAKKKGDDYEYEYVDLTDKEYTSSELGLNDEEEKTYRVSDFSGKVTLSQDSLNAFSMLENTHTLDADYIYRDFKELIVELRIF